MNNYIKWSLQSFRSMIMLSFSVVSVIIAVVVAVPQAIKIIDLQTDIFKTRQKINELAGQINILREFENQNLQERVNVLLTNLPLEFDAPFVISSIKQLGQDNSVELLEVATVIKDPQDQLQQEDSTGISAQQLDITVSGETENLVSFLQQIYKISPILQIKEVNYSVQNDNMPEAQILIESFALPQTQTTGDSKLGVPKFSAEQENLYQQLSQRKQYPFIPVSLENNSQRQNLFSL